jgi:HNH endonuclease
MDSQYSSIDNVLLCECGCTEPIPLKTQQRRKARPHFIKGHNFNIRTLQVRICPWCQKAFTPRVHTQVCCSKPCGIAFRGHARQHRVSLTCQVCHNPFEVKAHRATTAQFCSKACWGQRRKAFLKTCRTCKKSFDALDHRARFCSEVCHLQWKTGPTSPVWQGGKSTQRLRGRLSAELTKWRIAVYHRDKYICQHCGEKPRDIHAHHVKHLADFPALALDVANGITLCIPCHEKVHGRTLRMPSAFPKYCTTCHKPTKGRTLYCRACSIRQAHARKGHNPERECPYCRQLFQGRSDQRYCSTSCGMKARHQHATS